MIEVDADYVVYGAGAMGMAFVDVLLTESQARVILVDLHAQTGGHWNEAYPFVRLHQPSAFYGVNSRKLERTGDLLELASRNEILAYYEGVLDTFLKSGRVQYFPMCSWDSISSRRFYSLVDKDHVYQIGARAKLVDATYMNVVVPSISDPRMAGRYEVEDGVELVPINDLVKIGIARDRYVIVGAGKTGMDAVLWLVDNGVQPDRITWVMPRDAWIINRELIAFVQHFREGIDLFSLVQAFAEATSVNNFYEIVEKGGIFQRLDQGVTPTRNKCATVSPEEMVRLRTVKDVVRLGRLRRIEQNRLIFASNEEVLISGNAIFVDCTTDGLVPRPPVPIFQGDAITLQSVTLCQQVFSAALIAKVETSSLTDSAKNAMTVPAPHPDTPADLIKSMMIARGNLKQWQSHKDVYSWLKKSRLFGEYSMINFMSYSKAVRWFFSPSNLMKVWNVRNAEEKAVTNMASILSKL